MGSQTRECWDYHKNILWGKSKLFIFVSLHCEKRFKNVILLPFKKKSEFSGDEIWLFHTVTDLVWISFVWIPTSQSGVWIYADIVPFTVIISAPFFVTWREIERCYFLTLSFILLEFFVLNAILICISFYFSSTLQFIFHQTVY